MKLKIPRRSFLQAAGIGALSLSLAACGGDGSSSFSSSSSSGSSSKNTSTETPADSYGNSTNTQSSSNTSTEGSNDYDYVICQGGGYLIVAKQEESVTDVTEYVGVKNSSGNWVVPYSDNTSLNPNGKVIGVSTTYNDSFENRCKYSRIKYAGEGMFIFREYWSGYYAATEEPYKVSAYETAKGAKFFRVDTNTWVDVGYYKSGQSAWFNDGFYVVAGQVNLDNYKYVTLISKQLGLIDTDVYCGAAYFIGQYYDGLFFSYDGFYSIKTATIASSAYIDLKTKIPYVVKCEKVIDLSEYAGLIVNLPHFSNGKCTLVARNTNGTLYKAIIDKNGKFLQEFTEIS